MEIRKHLIFALLSISVSTISFAQNTRKADSLLKVYESSAAVDSNKVKALNDLFAEYRSTNEELAIKYVNLSIAFASKTNYTNGYALSLYNKGQFEGRHGNFDSSDYFISRSIIEYKKLNNKNGLASCNMAYGLNMYDKGNNKEALSFFFESLKYREQINDLKGVASCYTWIGNVYNTGMQKPQQAIEYYEKALKIQKEINDEKGLSFSYNNIGNVNFYLKKYEPALENYLKSVELKEKINDLKGLSSTYNNLGNVYATLQQFEKAIVYYNKSLIIYEDFGDKTGVISNYVNIGNVYYEQKKFQKAIQSHTKALKESEALGYKEGIREAAFNLSMAYEGTNNTAKALELYKYSTQINDSIINTDFNSQIVEMETKYEVEKKDLELVANKKHIEKEKAQRNLIIAALLFFILLFVVAIWAFIQKRKNSRILQEKNLLLEDANHEISHQKEQLSEKQKEILDSIYYAKKIQNALLASEEMIMENLLDHFILFKPKDIVSGDFTWATKKDNLFYLACCDSTGHGVPGAFMSLLNIGFLSEAIKERNILEPGKIFDYVRARLIETIGNDEQKDGFDGILLCVDMDTKKITYTAANNNPLLIQNKELIHLPTNKMPVGQGIKTDHFETYHINCEKGDSIYLYTDGYPDQFGGPKGKKFKYKQLEDLLLNNVELSSAEQKEKLNATFESWKGNLEQVDDVCIIGIFL